MKCRRGFTLIELLIVVAIIAILAAIAIPNLLSAQVRAKVSRAASDQRNISTGLESYVVDWNRLPIRSAYSTTFPNLPYGMRVLTTPIAYMGTSFEQFIDPFAKWNSVTLNRVEVFYECIYGSLTGARNGRNRVQNEIRDAYIIESVGPDQLDSIHTGFWGHPLEQPTSEDTYFIPYDPSNGVVSTGDLYRTGGRIPDWFKAKGWPMSVPSG